MNIKSNQEKLFDNEEKAFNLIQKHWENYVKTKNYSTGIGIIIIILSIYSSIFFNKYISFIIIPCIIALTPIIICIINIINESIWKKKLNNDLDNFTLLKIIIDYIESNYTKSSNQRLNIFKKIYILNQKLELNNIIKNVTRVLEGTKSSIIENNIRTFKSQNPIYKIEANNNKEIIDTKIDDWYKRTKIEYSELVESLNNNLIISDTNLFHMFHIICCNYLNSLNKEYNLSNDINGSSENCPENPNSDNMQDIIKEKPAYHFIIDNYFNIFVKYSLLIALIFVLAVSLGFHFYIYFKKEQSISELLGSMNSIVTQIVAILLLKFDINSQSQTR